MSSDSKLAVTFQRSGISATWSDSVESLLELAELQGVDISYGCRFGDCGTCMTRILSGSVVYEYPTGTTPDPDFCLPCCSKPLTSIVLDI
jgi:ferredoxin